jgi:hypothetical protein
MATLLRTPRTQCHAPVEEIASVPEPAPAPAAPTPAAQPAESTDSLPSDYLALVTWLACGAIILSLLAKDLFTALTGWR